MATIASIPPEILIQNELEKRPLKVKPTIKILTNTTRKASFSPKVIKMIKLITLASPSLTPGTKKTIPDIAVSTIDKTTDIEIMIDINTSFLTFKVSTSIS